MKDITISIGQFVYLLLLAFFVGACVGSLSMIH